MKALFIIESIGLGHAVRTYEIIKEFLRRGNDVETIAHNHAAYFLKSKKIPTNEVPLSILPQKNKDKFDVGKTLLQGMRLRNITAIGTIGGIIKKKKPDVIVIDTSVIGVMAANTSKNKTTPIIFVTTDNTYQSGFKSEERGKQNFNIIDNFVKASVDSYIVPDFPPPYTISEYNLIFHKKMNFVGPLSWVKEIKIPKKTNGVIITQGKSDVISEKIEEMLKDNTNILSQGEYEKKFISAEVIIHHGGHATAMDCICSAKPQITVPVTGYTERINNCRKIERLGLGKNLDENWLDKNTLEHAIEEIKEHKKYIEKFSKYARSYNAPRKIYEIYENLSKK